MRAGGTWMRGWPVTSTRDEVTGHRRNLRTTAETTVRSEAPKPINLEFLDPAPTAANVTRKAD